MIDGYDVLVLSDCLFLFVDLRNCFDKYGGVSRLIEALGVTDFLITLYVEKYIFFISSMIESIGFFYEMRYQNKTMKYQN